MKLHPWGLASWLMPRIGSRQWHVVAASSFEDRCLATVEWLRTHGISVQSATLFKISNPPSDHWREGAPIVERNFDSLVECLDGAKIITHETSLLDSPLCMLVNDAIHTGSAESVVLDITTLPKKFFLFAFKKLFESKNVKDLVLTYARAKGYPEVRLCEDALPPTALHGFARTRRVDDPTRMIVGVGYVPLSIEELLDKAKNSKLDFVFPFPPASPAFRRNWALLSMLMPMDALHSTGMHRVHGMDAFEVFERLKGLGKNFSLDMIPLGPKPHALGMAMAYVRSEERAEIIYPQPRVYNVKYSEGIAREPDGTPSIFAYCLKRDGCATF